MTQRASSPQHFAVPFTEYRLPNGAKHELSWWTDNKEIYAKARAIMAHGFVFEIERLTNGIISATITDRMYGDFDSILARNDKTLTIKITDMIRAFDIDKATARRERMQNDEHDTDE